VVRVPVQEGEGRLRPTKRVPRPFLLHRHVAEAGVDVCSQLNVIAHGGELQGSTEVLLREVVMAGVVGHPAGHLRESSDCAESVLATVDETRRDLVLQVPDHRSVHVAATHPAVSLSERLHGVLDGVVPGCPELVSIGR
jgi:hypothetical protein